MGLRKEVHDALIQRLYACKSKKGLQGGAGMSLKGALRDDNRHLYRTRFLSLDSHVVMSQLTVYYPRPSVVINDAGFAQILVRYFIEPKWGLLLAECAYFIALHNSLYDVAS